MGVLAVRAMTPTSATRKNLQGFTLLELIATLGILSLLVSAVVMILDQTGYQVKYLTEELSRRGALSMSFSRHFI